MDPPDKKRTQSPNVDSAATPPSPRQLSGAAAGAAGQQPAASSAHPTEVTAAAADTSAAPAAASPLMSTGPAVSAASRLSPAERCPSDPLSVALSFLDARNFAAASRVCRHWQRTAELQSAWPEFSVERLIDGLIEDEDHWTQSRSVRVSAYYFGARALERLTQSPKWRRLSELYLDGYTNKSVSLAHVLQLPHLQSLHVSGISLGNIAAAFSVGSRLQALCCSGQRDNRTVQRHLHLLANLRVLSLDQKDEIDAQALLPLHQLEYLQLLYFNFPQALLLAIRRLSVQRRLRHLSLASYTRSPLEMDSLVAELSGADSGLAPAALATIRLNCYLSASSRSALLLLPGLTRLEWSCSSFSSEPATSPHSSTPPSPLQQLRLDFHSKRSGGAAQQLLECATIRAPQLRELHITRPPSSFGQLIRPLRSLRLLEIELWESSSLSPELAQSLTSLPLFSQLVVRQIIWRPPTFRLSMDTLRCIAESPSWRLIRLIGLSEGPQLALPNGVAARLAKRLINFNVRSEGPGSASVHRLVISAQGVVAWLQTTM